MFVTAFCLHFHFLLKGRNCLLFLSAFVFIFTIIIYRYFKKNFFFRDMRLVSIGGGADEVMLSIICKFMDTLPKPGK